MTSTTYTRHTEMICQDCHMALAGYDAHDLGEAESWDEIARDLDGAASTYNEDADGQFMFRACYSCGTDRPGDRYEVEYIETDK